MAGKQKLELTWIGKENRPKLEPRILIEDPEKSYHASFRVKTGKEGKGGSRGAAESAEEKLRDSAALRENDIGDIFDNRLIFGDNLLALKALEAEFAGKVKCVFIDPPYNTGSAFVHYDDGVEHSIWLGLIRDRLELIKSLLSVDGSLWITIDDNECHYLKVLCDEVFGRNNFVNNAIWQKKYSPSNDSKWFSDDHDHILIYAKSKDNWRPNKLERSDETNSAYKNPDHDIRGPWRPDNYKCNKTSDERPNLYYPIFQPNLKKEIWPKKTAVWRYNETTHKRHIEENLIWWGKDGKNDIPAYKRFLKDVDLGVVPQTIWTWNEVGHTQDGKREQQALHPTDPFGTPKPEKLISRVITLATNPGDLVLDSFLGSGTTAAVAHKMGRRWIGIELGEHCHTHCIPRLKKVIDGQDPGGITEAVGWQGGGGFRYYRLAPSLLEQDKWGNWVISKEYNAAMLAEALCKLEGFRYEPSDSVYWMQGRSTETDFMYTTTQNLSVQQLQELSDEVGPNRSLLVLCSAFRGDGNAYPNLTLKKIPKSVLAKCEWGHDDYSLKIENLPKADPARPVPTPVNAGRKAKAVKPGLVGEPDLFGATTP